MSLSTSSTTTQGNLTATSATAVSFLRSLADQLGIDSAAIAITGFDPVYEFVEVRRLQLAIILVVKSYTIIFTINALALSQSPLFSSAAFSDGESAVLNSEGLSALSSRLIDVATLAKATIINDIATEPSVLRELGISSASEITVSGLTAVIFLPLTPTPSPRPATVSSDLPTWFVPVVVTGGFLFTSFLFVSIVCCCRYRLCAHLFFPSDDTDATSSKDRDRYGGGITIRTRGDEAAVGSWSIGVKIDVSEDEAEKDTSYPPRVIDRDIYALDRKEDARVITNELSFAQRLALADIQPAIQGDFANLWHTSQ